MFSVYENGKLADCHNFKVDKSWDNARFSTLNEAVDYAMNWLGVYAPSREVLASMKPYDYSGYGGKIQIKEERE